jgi:uncharacterized membrane protein
MFDSEKAITDWRRRMLAAGIKTPVPLEELESHLRGEIERQMKSGMNAQRAFGEAIQQIGPPNALQSEFQKANALTVERKRPIAIAAGVLTVFVGFILVWATVVQSRDMGRTANEVVVLFVLGLILVFDGAAVSFLASKRSFLASKRKA